MTKGIVRGAKPGFAERSVPLRQRQTILNPYPVPLLVADGDIPTTRLLARELREGLGTVEVRIAKDLFGAEFGGRPVIVSRLCYPRFSWLPGYLSRRRLRYAYFLDDNFWEITHQTGFDLANFFQHPATVETLDAFVRDASVVICWSPRLREYVAARHPDAITEFVRPGFDVATATRLLERRDAQPAEPRRWRAHRLSDDASTARSAAIGAGCPAFSRTVRR